MSLLQDYKEFREDIGEEMFKKIEEYLKDHPKLFLNDLMYNQEEWSKFQDWYTKG